MSDNIDHLSLQPTAVVDAVVSPLPEPSAALLAIPGFREWFNAMKLVRERDKETLYRMILTKIAGGIAGEASSGLNRFAVVGRSVINANGTINNQTTNNTGGSGGTGGTTTIVEESDDALLVAWTGL